MVRLNRLTHMYVALFLTPWLLMYALSTGLMNHSQQLTRLHGGPLITWEVESTRMLTLAFSKDATPEMMGEQIARAVDIRGNVSARLSRDGKQLVVMRNHAIMPERIMYTLADGTAKVERRQLQAFALIVPMHTRRSYQSPYIMDDLWALSVDVWIVAVLVWIVSGIWMWWRLKTTRLFGLLGALTGFALYGFFLFKL